MQYAWYFLLLHINMYLSWSMQLLIRVELARLTRGVKLGSKHGTPRVRPFQGRRVVRHHLRFVRRRVVAHHDSLRCERALVRGAKRPRQLKGRQQRIRLRCSGSWRVSSRGGSRVGPRSRESFDGSRSTPVARRTERLGYPVRLHVWVTATLRSLPLLSANIVRNSSEFENSGNP